MDSIKTKTKIYLLILSLVMTLVGVAVMKSNQGKPLSSQQQMKALEKAAPASPSMARFLEQQKETEEADRQAGRDLSK